MIELMEHQKDAVKLLGNGKILYGHLGTGKSRTALAYYMEQGLSCDIYVITTAKKRDSLDWMGEAAGFGIGTERDATIAGILHVDSWNNIGKYTEIEEGFFIFDEQRVTGHGAWVKSFLKITKKNHWILLTATPGDVWLDYAPVFVANGYYKSLAEFKREHVIYAPYIKYPQVIGYFNEDRLEWQRNEVLVEAPYVHTTERVMNYMDVGYDQELWDIATKDRWNPYEDAPIKDAGEYFRVTRKIVNSDPSRLQIIRKLMTCHPRLVIFYNFNYELAILRNLANFIEVAEWNGHNKNPVPIGSHWIYLVQYMSGAEGWNCTSTNAMVMYSLNYSYRTFVQSTGRIDRLDTEYSTLYYYMLVSGAKIDRKIKEALDRKESFNEADYLKTEPILPNIRSELPVCSRIW